MEETTKSAFTLPHEKVIVKFIPRKRGMAANVGKNHVISGGLLNKAVIKYQAPIQRNGKIANVLTAEEKEYLERVTGLKLSVYNDFFYDFFVTLRKDDSSNHFDLSDPMDYISYKILMATEEVAPDWESRNLDQVYKFAITREGEVKEEKKKGLDDKMEAFKMYGKIEDDHEKLLSVLRLVSNRAIAKSTKLKWLQAEVQTIVDEQPSKFLSVIKDSNFEIKSMLNKAIDAKVVIKEGNQYVTVDGLQLCKNGEIATFDTAVRFLAEDKNQEVYHLIQARLEDK